MKGKAQIKIRIGRDLRDHLRGYAVAHGQTMSTVTEAALTAYLNPEDYKVVALRYLADIEKENRQQIKRLDLIEETLGQFVQLYFFYTPETADDDSRKVMMKSARKRFEGFLKLVSTRIQASKTYRDAFEEVHFAEADFHFHGGSQ